MKQGLRVGLVAAAATVGAVIGLGLRHGLASRPFESVGRALLTRLGVDAAASSAVATGLVVVSASVVLLGLCFTLVAAPLRGVRLVATALVFGAIAWVIETYVVPSILVSGSSVVLGTAQRVFVITVLALALVAGMRLARSRVHIE